MVDLDLKELVEANSKDPLGLLGVFTGCLIAYFAEYRNIPYEEILAESKDILRNMKRGIESAETIALINEMSDYITEPLITRFLDKEIGGST